MTLPWIKLFVDMPDHPKCDELAVALGDEDAWSRVVALWCWAAKFRPNGDLAGISSELVARRARWKGDAATFVQALKRVGLMTTDGVLHDFADIQGAHAAKLERDKARSQERRATVARPSRDGPSRVAGPSGDRRVDVAGERRGEEKRGEEKRGPDPDARALAPINPDRPEPLGPFGERMPRASAEVLDYKPANSTETVRERLHRKFPALTAEQVVDGVEAAMTHRLTLEGPMLRRWFWPAGFISKAEDWLRRNELDALRTLDAKKRVQRTQTLAGEHVVAPAAPSPADRVAENRDRVAAYRKKLTDAAKALGKPPPPGVDAPDEDFFAWRTAHADVVNSIKGST